MRYDVRRAAVSNLHNYPEGGLTTIATYRHSGSFDGALPRAAAGAYCVSPLKCMHSRKRGTAKIKVIAAENCFATRFIFFRLAAVTSCLTILQAAVSVAAWSRRAMRD